MRFDEIIGDDSALELLRGMLRSGRVPHALILHGPQGVGKGDIAAAFAMALLCETQRADSDGCGACEGCRLVSAGNHPDLTRITRQPKKSVRGKHVEEGDLRSSIVVDQIRELTRLAALKPRRAPRRLFVIDPADRMNVESQNALLKTLEEPPGRTVLLLVASRPHALLPTVRSRSFSVGFAAFAPRRLATLLEDRGLSAEEALARAALAAGRPALAVALDLEAYRARRDSALRMLERLLSGPEALRDLSAMASDVAGRTERSLDEGLDLLQALLRDAARTAFAAANTIGHVDVAERLSRLGTRIGPTRAAEIVGAIDRLRAQSRLNLNRTLVAESVLAAVAGGPIP